MNKKLTAVIVTYNRLEKLKKAISTMLNQDIDKIVVVNNKSTDGTANWLNEVAREDKRLIPVHREDNTGGAGGFYYGLKYVHENKIDGWVVLYDDDAYPSDSFVSDFKSLELDDNVGAVTACVKMPNETIADFNRPGISPFNSLITFLKYLFSKDGIYLSSTQMNNSNKSRIDFSTFVGFIVRADLIPKIGYPIKEFFIYCDDWLYSYSVTKAGYKNLYFSELTFYHDSNTFIQNYDEQLWKKYYALRNSIYFYRQVCGLFFPFVFLLKFAKWIYEIKNYKSKSSYLKTIVRACFDGFTFKNMNEAVKSV